MWTTKKKKGKIIIFFFFEIDFSEPEFVRAKYLLVLERYASDVDKLYETFYEFCIRKIKFRPEFDSSKTLAGLLRPFFSPVIIGARLIVFCKIKYKKKEKNILGKQEPFCF